MGATVRLLAAHAQVFFKLAHLSLSLVARYAVAFLHPTGQHFGIALDDFQIIVGQLAPLLLNLSTDLFPLTADRVLVHNESLMPIDSECRRRASDDIHSINRSVNDMSLKCTYLMKRFSHVNVLTI